MTLGAQVRYFRSSSSLRNQCLSASTSDIVFSLNSLIQARSYFSLSASTSDSNLHQLFEEYPLDRPVSDKKKESTEKQPRARTPFYVVLVFYFYSQVHGSHESDATKLPICYSRCEDLIRIESSKSFLPL